MKKTYISPKMDIVEIEKQALLAGSDQVPVGDSGDAGNAEAPIFYDDFEN